MLGEILLSIGIFVGALGGLLLKLRFEIPTSERRRAKINDLIKKGYTQREAERRVDENARWPRRTYYIMMVSGPVMALIGGLIMAFAKDGGA